MIPTTYDSPAPRRPADVAAVLRIDRSPRLIQLTDQPGIPTWTQMPIGIHRDLDRTMAGLLLDVLGMSASLNE